MQNYLIFPRFLDQHPMVQIRVCTVCTEDKFALDPFPMKSGLGRYTIPHQGFARLPLWNTTQSLEYHRMNFEVFYSPSTPAFLYILSRAATGTKRRHKLLPPRTDRARSPWRVGAAVPGERLRTASTTNLTMETYVQPTDESPRTTQRTPRKKRTTSKKLVPRKIKTSWAICVIESMFVNLYLVWLWEHVSFESVCMMDTFC